MINKLYLQHHAFLFILLCIASLYGCDSHGASASTDADQGGDAAAPEEHANRVQLTAEAMVNVGIEVQPVVPQTYGPRLEVPATIEGDAQLVSRMGARAPGRVVALLVSVGDRVRVGDPLFQLATIELHQVSTEYLVAIARSRQAVDALRRARALNDEHVGPLADVRRAQADAAAAQATLHESEEHLHFLGLRETDIQRIRATSSHGRTNSMIRAQIDGIVSAIHVTIGQVLQGTEEIAVISRTDRVWAHLHLYERDLQRVRAGAHVSIRLQGAESNENGESNEADLPSGTLSFISNLLDSTTHTGDGRVMLENPQGILRIGMTATALVEVPSAGPQLWLPQQAVQLHEGKSIVFVQDGEREFVAHEVRVGEEHGGRVAVLEGLVAGQRVVVRGAFSLRSELEHDELSED